MNRGKSTWEWDVQEEHVFLGQGRRRMIGRNDLGVIVEELN